MFKNWIKLLFFNIELDSLRRSNSKFFDIYACKVIDKPYTKEIVFKIPSGKSYKFFIEHKEIFEATLQEEIEIEIMNVSYVKFIITKQNLNIKYEPIQTKAYELYLAREGLEPIIINLNKFPHMLIGGETGTGKSRLLLLALTNLIANNNNVDLYLTQIRKGELSLFSTCKQCKYLAKSLEDARDMLKHLDKLCMDREKKIEKYLMQGIYNIEDYNKKFRYGLNYVYIILDEFSFFNPNGADTKEEKTIKKEILSYIKNISMVGRSSGVFLITSLQKPTSSSIPSDIKSQLCTRISFKQLDNQSSIVILGNGNATGLMEREVIVRTLEEVKCKVPYIDHSLIMENIKCKIENNHKFIKFSDNKDIANNNVKIKSKQVKNDGIIDLGVIKNAK